MVLLRGFANQLDKMKDLCGGKFQKLSDWHSAEEHGRKSLIGSGSTTGGLEGVVPPQIPKSAKVFKEKWHKISWV